MFIRSRLDNAIFKIGVIYCALNVVIAFVFMWGHQYSETVKQLNNGAAALLGICALVLVSFLGLLAIIVPVLIIILSILCFVRRTFTWRTIVGLVLSLLTPVLFYFLFDVLEYLS